MEEPRSLLLRFPLNRADREDYRWDCFWLAEPVTVQLGTGEWITVPVDYVTDGASVPRWLQGIFPAIGDHLLADLVHDYLYHTGYDRRAADQEFLRLMQIARPRPRSSVDNRLRYWAVRLFGRPYYRQERDRLS